MKILNAEIKDGKVLIDELNPDDVTILGLAESDSKGFLLVGEDNIAIYIANTQPDLKIVIAELMAVCESLKTLANAQYMTAAQGGVMGSPHASIGSKVDAIKNKLEKMELT